MKRADEHGRMARIAFFMFCAVCILLLGGHNFYRYYIAKEYPLQVFTACNPAEHSCFVADPAVADLTFQSGPYEKVDIAASAAPRCLDEHTCTDFSCAGVSGSCTITYCSTDALDAGESCTTGTQP